MTQSPPTPPQEPPPEPYALPWETVGTHIPVGPYDNLPEPKQEQPPAPDADGDWYESRTQMATGTSPGVDNLAVWL